MPAIFFQPTGRRDFLKTAGKTLAACLLTSQLSKPLWAAPDSQRLHLALLSDTHVAADPNDENRKFRPTDNLKLVVSQILETRPQAALLNGDAARLTGEVDDYHAVKSLLNPLAEQCPIYVSLGNHDSRENLLKVFSPPAAAAQKVGDKQVLLIEQSFQRVVLLDSLLYVNKTAGLLGKSQRDWLDRFLAKADLKPTVLFVHHTLGDGDGELLDAEALFRIVQPYAKVKAIFYGHSHEYSYRQRQGIHLINLPAVGYNFADREPVGWVDAQFHPRGVELTLKAIGGNRDQDGQTTSLTWRNV